MNQVNIHEAKTNLSKLLQDALAGKETIIAKAGKPIAKLVPLDQPTQKRRLGGLKDKADIKVESIKDIKLSDEEKRAFGMLD